MHTFQLVDDRPDEDGVVIDLDTVRIARYVPVLFDHSRNKIIGRLVKGWRDGSRILGQLEFANTPSGHCAQWSAQAGLLSHVSPMFLYGKEATVIHDAVIVEVTLTSLVGEPKSVRNVCLSQPAHKMSKPQAAMWWQANRFDYDRAAIQGWLESQRVIVDGIAIDATPYEWEDPCLPEVPA